MRRSATVHDSTGIAGGDHVCWAFSSDDEHRRVLTDYLLAGLRADERLVFLGSPRGREQLAATYLTGAGVDAAALLATGQLIAGSTEDAYLGAGGFDPDARLREYADLATAAVADGYRGLRLAVEATGLHAVPQVRAMMPGYELRGELLASRLPVTGLCCYDTRVWSSDEVAVLRAVHSVDLDPGGERSPVPVRVHAARVGTIAVAGELDAALAGPVARALTATVADARPVLDLSGLTFVDVAGARAIADTAAALARRHGQARLAGVRPPVRRLWELLNFGLDHPTVTVD